MPARLKPCSGKECVRILCNKFGFSLKRQKGSHVVLVKEVSAEKFITVVPLHNELKLGTLKGVLELAKVSEDAFADFQ